MKRLLSLDSPPMRFLALIANLIILNTLFILTSIPLITIGASLCALQTSIQNILRKKDERLIANYFRLFQNNFKQATISWLIIVVLGLFFFLDFRLLGHLFIALSFLFGVVTILAVVFLAIEISYLFAYIGRYQDKLQVAVKNVLGLSLQHLFQTVFLVIYNSFIVYFALSSPVALLTMIYLFTFGGFAFINYFSGVMIKQVFDKLERN